MGFSNFVFYLPKIYKFVYYLLIILVTFSKIIFIYLHKLFSNSLQISCFIIKKYTESCKLYKLFIIIFKIRK